MAPHGIWLAKLLEFILRGSWRSKPRFMAMHPMVVEIFHSETKTFLTFKENQQASSCERHISAKFPDNLFNSFWDISESAIHSDMLLFWSLFTFLSLSSRLVSQRLSRPVSAGRVTRDPSDPETDLQRLRWQGTDPHRCQTRQRAQLPCQTGTSSLRAAQSDALIPTYEMNFDPICLSSQSKISDKKL